MEYSETLDEHGNFLQNIIGQNKHQKDFYKFAVDGTVSYCPRFTYHGFRYVRLTGARSFSVEDFTIHIIGTDMARTGFFECSDKRLNRLQENIYRSQQGNMISIPTDCPQRERTGWTGDMQIFAPTACFNMDVEMFLRKWLLDMRYEQLPDGQLPHIIPYFPSHDIMKPDGLDNVSAAGWSDACIIIPWRLYEAYGDITILSENYDMMLRYLKSVEKLASELPDDYDSMDPDRQQRQKYLWNTGFSFGDWLMPSLVMSGQHNPFITGYEVATLMFAYTTKLMSKIAHLLGHHETAEYYSELNQNIRGFLCRIYVPDRTAEERVPGLYVLALAMDAVPEAVRQRCIDRLEELIHQNGDRLDTGFLSVPFLLDTLYENGKQDLAYTLLYQTKCPSWLYEVEKGATTMWESWDNISEDGKRSRNSYNHFAFGCVGDFIYRRILGIQSVEPGYKRVIICPYPNCRLQWARGYYESVNGKIEVDWHIKEDTINLNVVIPPNIEAVVELCDSNPVTVGSGKYTFCASIPKLRG